MSVREGHFWGSAWALSTCEMWTITHAALAMYPSRTVTAFLRKQHYLLHRRPGSLWCCSPNALPSPGFWSQSPLNNLTKHEVLDWRLVSEGALFSHQIKRQSNPILWKHKSIYANYHPAFEYWKTSECPESQVLFHFGNISWISRSKFLQQRVCLSLSGSLH